ncbi:ATP-dependent DNA helicase RecG [Candidatus Methylocalor cossyra]|uniref:ATP-dependent DNA helicase RecG n=1 Tax=Candidatus Methylocalor cossyra TaxID=3108543 RepID=A0ABP1C669_9GAMM
MAWHSGSPDTLPIASLKGVGAQTLARLQRLGLTTVQDLLFHLPFRYEDRTRILPLGSVKPGEPAQVEGQIELVEVLPKGRRALIVRIADGTGALHLRFFHYTAAQQGQFLRGRRLRCYGEVREGYFGPEITHPDYQFVAEGEAGRAEPHLTPVYPLTEGVHQKTLRRLIAQALDQSGAERLTDWLPEGLSPYPQLKLWQALRLLHRPPAGSSEASPELSAARERLAFEELLAHQLSLSRFRQRVRVQAAPALRGDPETLRRFVEHLPFALTGAQRRVIAEIEADLALARPMMRLVQGDVGSGKTVVAAAAALTALASGHQVAIMAPTELLAEQHCRSFRQWLDPLGVTIVLLSGRLKGEQRKSALEAVAQGRAGVAIGTHALFQERVVFHRLGLVIIDEQHRFGVHQRLALREKGSRGGIYPHQLIMTATPIPRTLAMLGYADLDLSLLDERPPGRIPVNTVVIPTARRADVVARIGDWVAKGRQVYWVCTLIEESELLQCQAAEKSARLLAEALPAVRVGLIHGRQKPADKEAVMQSFKAGAIDLLVATTVIEVGMDVPNASLMVIENAERLGLAQLHQLRGRVGRGPGEAHCVLLYQPPLSAAARERLAILRESDDGFVIAEKDLAIRGPGELLGTRQTGQIQFRIADLARDRALLEAVRQAAEALLRDYPERVEPLIRRWVGDAAHYAEA